MSPEKHNTSTDRAKAIVCMGLGVGGAIGIGILGILAKRYEITALMTVIAIGGGIASHDELKAVYKKSKKKNKFRGHLPVYLNPHATSVRNELVYRLNLGPNPAIPIKWV